MSHGNRTKSQKGLRAGGQKWLPVSFILAATTVVYRNTLTYQFVYDDTLQIVNNPAVQSWRYLPRYFTSNVWSQLTSTVYYRPLFLIWLMLNYILFGANPVWWHLTTLFAHLVATVLVYFLARSITQTQGIALVSALIFGLHPVHIEAVAWVSGVTEPLLAIFFISSFLLYLRERASERAERSGWLSPALLLYLMALLTKETAVVLPVIIFTYEWIYSVPVTKPGAESGGRPYVETARRALADVIPYLSVTLIYLLVRALVLKSLVGTATSLPLSTTALTVPSLIWLYVQHLLWPVNLSVFYDTPYVTAAGSTSFVWPLLALGLLGIGLFYLGRRSRVIAFASVWLFVPLVPALKISAFSPGDIFHDRYLYLPSVGFSIIVAYTLRRLRIGAGTMFGLPVLQLTLAILAISMLGYATAIQSKHWATNFQLYSHSLAIVPNNHFALQNMAADLATHGFYRDAVPLYEQVLRQGHPSWNVYLGLGLCYYQIGLYQKSEMNLDKAIEMAPRNPAVRLQKGFTLLATDRLEEAESEVRNGMNFQAEDGSLNVAYAGPGTGSTYQYHLLLADILRRRGNLRAALNEYRKGLHGQPDEQAAAAAQRRITELEAALGNTRE